MPYGLERERLSTEVFPKEGCICCPELPCPAPEFYLSESGGLHYGWLPSPVGFHDDIVHDLPESAFRMLWLTKVNNVPHQGAVTVTAETEVEEDDNIIVTTIVTKTDVIDYDQYIFMEDALRTIGTAENPSFPQSIKVCSGSEMHTIYSSADDPPVNTGHSAPSGDSGDWAVNGATEGAMEEDYDFGGSCQLTWGDDGHSEPGFADGSDPEISYSAVLSETELLQEKRVVVSEVDVDGDTTTTYAGDYSVEKGYKDPLPFLYTVRLPFPDIDSPMMEVYWDVEFRSEGAEEYSKVGEENWEAVGHDALRLGGNFMHNYPDGSFGDFRITNVRFRCSTSQRFKDYATAVIFGTPAGPIALSTETAFD